MRAGPALRVMGLSPIMGVTVGDGTNRGIRAVTIVCTSGGVTL